MTVLVNQALRQFIGRHNAGERPRSPMFESIQHRNATDLSEGCGIRQ
jgi:hypothetical protein